MRVKKLGGLTAQVVLMAVGLAAAARGGAAAQAEPTAATSAATVQSVVDAAIHPWLRWGAFPDYQEHVRRTYEGDGYQLLWVREGRPTAQAVAVIGSLSGADTRGLSAADYDAERLQREAEQLANGSGSETDLGLFDSALTISLMRYVSDSYIGRINPRFVQFGYEVEPKKLDLPPLMHELAGDPAPANRLAALDPPFPTFVRLQEALAHYRGLAARSDLPAMPALPKLRPGDHNAGIPALRVWLTALEDLPADTRVPADKTLYDDALAKGVKHFQRRHGLDADAVIGKATAIALQVPPSARVRQIQLAMERLRWLPYTWPDRFLLVNIPEFRLHGFQAAGGPPLAMNVVVGESAQSHKTPVLHADMKYVVFRPFWLVPPGIARKEILPKVATDPNYLGRHNMELVEGRVRQHPGKDNSLGLVKFIFPNPYHVYLHDTPSKALFARQRRDFSHGCIRVADPRALAEFVLDGQRGWSPERIDQAMTSGPDDRRVDLQSPVPVYIFYTTVVIGDDGLVYFFDDIYGHDATLDQVLAKGYPYPS